MDAKNTIIKPWPKQGLSEHVRAAPTPPGPAAVARKRRKPRCAR